MFPILILLADGTSGDVTSTIAPLIPVALGGWGVMLILLLTDRLYTTGSYKALEKGKDAEIAIWKESTEKERTQREAAEKRAVIAVETAQVANRILDELKKKSGR